MLVQVPIFEILHKYDGDRVHDDIKLGRRRYKFTRLPKFLAMHMKRFAKNNFYVRALHPLAVVSTSWVSCLCSSEGLGMGTQTRRRAQLYVLLTAQVEKNPTIVNFPVKNLLLKDVLPVPTGARTECWHAVLHCCIMSCVQPGLWVSSGQRHKNADCTSAGKGGQPVLSRYDLLANIVHDGKAGEGSYRCHIHRKVPQAGR